MPRPQFHLSYLLRLAELEGIARVVLAVESPGCPRLRVIRLRGCWIVVEGDEAILHQGPDEAHALRVVDRRAAELLTPEPPVVRLRTIESEGPAGELVVDGRVVSANKNLRRLLSEALDLVEAHRGDEAVAAPL